MKISTKIFSTLLFSSLSLLLLASTIFFISEKRALEAQVYNQLHSVASLQQARLNSIREQNIERLKLVASRTQLRISLEKYLTGVDEDQHQSKMVRILKDAQASIKDFRDIHLFSLDGKIVSTTAETGSSKAIKFEKSLLEKAKSSDSADTLLLDNNETPLLLLTGPLYLNAKLLGVIIIESEVDNIIDSVSNYSGLGETGEIIVARKTENGDALFLFPTRFDPKASLSREMLKESKNCPLIKGITKNSAISSSTGLDYRGQEILAVTKYLDATDWTILVKIDREEAFSAISKAKKLIVSVTIILMILSILIAFFLSQNITKPILYLTNKTKEISKSNLLTKVEPSSGDEIGELANSFNEMAENLERAQQDLLKSQNFLEQIVENIPNMIFVKDAKDLRFVSFNKAGEEILGYAREELLGKSDYDFFPKEEADFFTEKDREVLSGGKCIDIPSEHIQTKNKGTRILHTKKIPIIDEDRSPQYLLGISEDITELYYSAREKEKLEEKLRQAHKMEAIGTLAGGIAHDFNNLLAAILGYADMARDDIPEHSPAKYQIEQVLKAGNRAKDLVRHILSFSRRESNERIPTKIDMLVKEALELLRASIPSTIEIKQNIDCQCGTIMAEPTQIHQIIMNLCTNAAQAMDERGGVLEVGLKVFQHRDGTLKEPHLNYGNYVQLSIKDNGVGIDKKNIDRIFDPYFTTKEVGKGSGMGLAVVMGIVRSHDGKIRVESELGKGTLFKLYFPQIAEQIQEKGDDAQALPTGKEKILVVDDEESMADMTKRRLERLGYEVTATTSSLAALELFRLQSEAFDLVITDQTMPMLTGDQLAQKIKEINSNISIILCTGYSSKVNGEKANLIGIDAFVMKPVEKQELARTIRQVLDGRPS